MNAIIAESGKQFWVKQGDTIQIDYREAAPGAPIIFDRVLLLSDGKDSIAVGQPTVTGAAVQGTILDAMRLKKIHVGVYRKRKNFRRHKGHRQTMTVVRIDVVNTGHSWSPAKSATTASTAGEPGA